MYIYTSVIYKKYILFNKIIKKENFKKIYSDICSLKKDFLIFFKYIIEIKTERIIKYKVNERDFPISN